jgi:hypothetical protein
MSLINSTTTATTRRMWMNPPIVVEVTIPSAQHTSRMIKMVQSMLHFLFVRASLSKGVREKIGLETASSSKILLSWKDRLLARRQHPALSVRFGKSQSWYGKFPVCRDVAAAYFVRSKRANALWTTVSQRE